MSEPLGLRLIVYALKQSALLTFGLNELKLKEQGTTATHVVYSCIDRFDVFFHSLLIIILN
jgi:hypothetical protein